jgi:hydrogenase/urease accessory protein HupE
MFFSKLKTLYLAVLSLWLLAGAAPAHAHGLPVSGSKWRLGSDRLIATIELKKELLSQIKGVTAGHYDLGSGSEKELQRLASEVIQPYVNDKLSFSVNGTAYPLKVDRIERETDTLFTVWLSTGKLEVTLPDNRVRIGNRMFFDEVGTGHMDVAWFYASNATGDELQKVFNYTLPNERNNFMNDATTWELHVKGAPKQTPAAPLPREVVPTLANAVFPKTVGAPLKRSTAPRHEDAASAGRAVGEEKPGTHPLHPAAAPLLNAHTQAVHDIPGSAASSAPGAVVQATHSPWSSIGDFVLLGIEHILTGYDHIAFLIGLIVIGLTIREVLKVITAFTVAHSITLLLAALQVVRLDSRFVESVIALSICYIALENLFRKEVRYRWLIAFCFGMVHGFGFASALQELIVGKTNLVLSVVSFNVGVETGQLMIFFVLLPLMYLMKQMMDFRKVTATVSCAIFLLGFTWLVERLFDLKLISS